MTLIGSYFFEEIPEILQRMRRRLLKLLILVLFDTSNGASIVKENPSIISLSLIMRNFLINFRLF